MLATIPSATLVGVQGRPVVVEVHVSNGLPGFTIVGLPDEACRESRDRVRAALLSSGLRWPQQRVTVNLAPSGVRKGGGTGLDLPIAIGLLVATEQVPVDALAGVAFVGELGLDGSLRRIPGVVPLAAAAGERVVVPSVCAHEAELVVPRGGVRCAPHLAALVAALRGEQPWPDAEPDGIVADETPPPELADVRGQATARFALEVAAAGGHHLLMVGPPGAGKTMLAARLAPLLPPLDTGLAMEATMIRSAAGLPLPPGGLVRRAPFRAPHHSASMVSLIGGGTSAMRPGEISLAHGGVLFLDELGEFQPSALDGLRQPLEEGVVRVVRARASVEYPARFLLVGAMNPCPCGAAGTPGGCGCSEASRSRYLRRVSGPLLDRFDLRLELTRPSVTELFDAPRGEGTAEVGARVAAARAVAVDRAGTINALVPAGALADVLPLAPAAAHLLRAQLEAGLLSARGLHRVHRVARTIADLRGGGERIEADHVALALSLRQRFPVLDRQVA